LQIDVFDKYFSITNSFVKSNCGVEKLNKIGEELELQGGVGGVDMVHDGVQGNVGNAVARELIYKSVLQRIPAESIPS
jgi:hypothetical protein